MRITSKKWYFKRQEAAPPSVDGGSVSSPGGGDSAPAASAEPVSTVVDGVDSRTGEDVALRAQLKEAAQAMGDKYAPKPDPAEPKEPVKAENTLLHDAAQMSQPTEAPAVPEGTEVAPENPEALKEEEVANPEEVQAEPAPIKIGSEEYHVKDLETIVNYAKNADEYIKAIDTKVAKLKEQESSFVTREASFAEKEAKIQERLSSPEMVLLETLANDPELRDEFYKMACQRNPEIEGKYNHAKSSQTIEQLRKEVQELKQGFNKKIESEQVQTKQQQQQFQQRQVQQFVEDVTTFEKEQSAKFGIDQEYVQMIEHNAAELMRQGRLPRDAKAVKNYILGQYQKIDNDFKAREAKARNVYIGEKQKAPPPPPTGGGPTRISPPRPKTFADAEAALNSRINSLKS